VVGRNSLLNTFLFYQALAYMGLEAGDWIRKLERGGAGDRLTLLAARLRGRSTKVDVERVNLGELRDFLAAKRDFLLRLLENPNLLEHESFTDLLQSVFHLTEELVSRESLDGLPASDRRHLAGDMARVSSYLASEWLDYMKHLE
jgi:hypothetical protein